MKQEIIRKPKSWTEPIESKNFYQFKNIGDTLEGMLISKDDSGDKMVFYTLKSFDGETKKFHGTSQLDDLLDQLSIPCYVKITYVSTQQVTNGTMKVFEVCKGEN
jgi:hypothetical protein